MLLAIDIGNTNIVLGLLNESGVITSWRVATHAARTGDEYGSLFSSLFALNGLDPAAITGCALCSVVPSVQAAVVAGLHRYWAITPLIVTPDSDTGLPIRYSPPEAVGADRIANAVAAIERAGPPAIVVDFGTATTFDAISEDGAYVGGAIAPGIEIAAQALFSRTARLASVPLVASGPAIGETTTASLQSGIVYGYAALVDGLTERLQAELGGSAHVLATGGLAPVVVPHTRRVRRIEPDLTLYGLQSLYRRSTCDPRARQA